MINIIKEPSKTVTKRVHLATYLTTAYVPRYTKLQNQFLIIYEIIFKLEWVF